MERYTYFADVACTQKTEMWEYFQRRADKLTERREYATDELGEKRERLVEKFSEGHSFALQSLKSVRGRSRTSEYYTAARLDGLVKRSETFVESDASFHKWITPTESIARLKTVEEFQGRDDRMIYRSIKYLPMTTEELHQRAAREAARAGPEMIGQEFNQPILKITIKYDRDPNVKIPGEDIQKVRFLVAEEQIHVTYHYGEGSITQAFKHFSRAGTRVGGVNPWAAPATAAELAQEMSALVQQEREAMMAARRLEADIKEMMIRRQEEDSGGVTVPFYDYIRENQEEEEDVEDDEGDEADPLAPYLPADYKPRKPLAYDQAKEVRRKALEHLKGRLLAREAIIQNRLKEEAEMLRRKQQTFQRDRDGMGREEEEQHEIDVERAMFRIHILDQRKRRHDEEALLKFYELDRKLKQDDRLRVLLTRSPSRAARG